MSLMQYKCVLSSVLVGLLAGCATIDKRVDVDAPDDVGGAVLHSDDIVAMSDKFARKVIESGILRSNDPEHRISFHITSLRNDSADPMDTELVLTKLRTQISDLLGRQVRILDRSKEGLEAVKAEIKAKREAAVTANPNLKGSLAGSDYVMKGTIKDRSVQGRGLKSVYYLVTFELTDLETSELVCTSEYETKYVSEKSVISR